MLAAVAEAMPLAVIYLVAIIMACDLHRVQVEGRTIEFGIFYVFVQVGVFLSFKCQPV